MTEKATKNNSKESNFIPSMNIKRLLNDVKTIYRSPLHDNGIFYSHDQNDILKGYALIIGPKDTVYDSGCYLFEFYYPSEYPFKPPKVTYKTNDGFTRFNPNLYKNGKVCISLLNTWQGEQWSSCQNISTILLNLVALLNNTPLLNEPGITNRHQDYENYNKIIRFQNLNFSVLKFFNTTYMPSNFFELHKNYITYLKENIDRLEEHVKNLADTEKKQTVHVGIYKMNTTIDYKNLHKEFCFLKKSLQI